jgi:hypothetical protein
MNSVATVINITVAREPQVSALYCVQGGLGYEAVCTRGFTPTKERHNLATMTETCRTRHELRLRAWLGESVLLHDGECRTRVRR